MIEDLKQGAHFQPTSTSVEAASGFVRSRQSNAISYDDWLKIDAAERAAGEAQGRPRVKFTSTEEMIGVLNTG